MALCVLGGEGHFFFANYDWLTRDAVLADLVRQSFPVLFDYQGSEFFLRAPLGMYMIPSAVGKLLGLRSAHLALLAQNATILALTLTLLMALVPRRKAVFLVAFIGFSGIEIVGAFINAGFKLAAFGTFTWPVHMHQHLAMWNPFFEYTNHITQIFWVPNHALPGWWLAATIGARFAPRPTAFCTLWFMNGLPKGEAAGAAIRPCAGPRNDGDPETKLAR